MQKHLVGGQLLLNDVIPVDGHDGHANEKVEVIRLRGRRAGFRSGPRWRPSAELWGEAVWAPVVLGKPHPSSACLPTGTRAEVGTYTQRPL